MPEGIPEQLEAHLVLEVVPPMDVLQLVAAVAATVATGPMAETEMEAPVFSMEVLAAAEVLLMEVQPAMEDLAAVAGPAATLAAAVEVIAAAEQGA
jgi:hypothetical protein